MESGGFCQGLSRSVELSCRVACRVPVEFPVELSRPLARRARSLGQGRKNCQLALTKNLSY